MTINTKQADRRDLSFATLDQLSAELDRIEAAQSTGTLRHTGNWTPGQVLRHCAVFMRCAMDGFPPGKPPAPVKWMAILLFKKKAAAGQKPPPGFKLPKQASYLLPGDVSFEEGLSEMRTMLARLRAGETFSHPSPLFGKFTHDEWTRLHLGHCALHLSFLHPDGA